MRLFPLLFLLGCAPKDTGVNQDTDEVASTDTDANAGAEWATTDALTVDLATPFVTLAFVAPSCADPQIDLVSSDGAEQRTFSVVPTVAGDALTATVPVDRLMPEAQQCSLDRRLTIDASVRCGDGDLRKVTPSRSLARQVGAQPVNGLSSPVRLFHRRSVSEAFDDIVWSAVDGAAVGVTLPGAAVGRQVEIPGVEMGDVGLHVRGATHDFLAVRCTARCPDVAPPSFAPAATLPSAYVLAVPLDAHDGPQDAVARVAVPAGVVDLAFHDGVLSVLSELDGHAYLSTFDEKPSMPTDAPLSARVIVLPASRVVAFQPDPTGAPLILMVGASSGPGKLEVWDPALNDTIPVPTPTGDSGCGGTTVIIGGGGIGGGSSVPRTSGDEAGTAGGTVSGTTVSGCIKNMSMSVQVGALRAAPADATLTLGLDDWTTTLPAPASLSEATVVDGASWPDHLVVALGVDRSEVRLLMVDLVAKSASWMEIPGDAPDAPRATLALRHLAVSREGLVVSTDTGVHVFAVDGTWLAGTEALPQACLSSETPEAYQVVQGQVFVSLRDGAVAFGLP